MYAFPASRWAASAFVDVIGVPACKSRGRPWYLVRLRRGPSLPPAERQFAPARMGRPPWNDRHPATSRCLPPRTSVTSLIELAAKRYRSLPLIHPFADSARRR